MKLLSKDATLEESLLNMKKILSDVGCEMNFSHSKHPWRTVFLLISVPLKHRDISTLTEKEFSMMLLWLALWVNTLRDFKQTTSL